MQNQIQIGTRSIPFVCFLFSSIFFHVVGVPDLSFSRSFNHKNHSNRKLFNHSVNSVLI
ncbi:unnamed protein product [Prunus brigantina]